MVIFDFRVFQFGKRFIFSRNLFYLSLMFANVKKKAFSLIQKRRFFSWT